MDKEEIQTANVIRSMIQHENSLTNDRISWLVTIQGLLFASFGIVWNSNTLSKELLSILGLLGILVAVSSLQSLTLANKARHELVAWWNDYIADKSYEGPPIIGTYSASKQTLILGETSGENRKLLTKFSMRKITRYFSRACFRFSRCLRPWRLLPWVFIVGWMGILVIIFELV